MPFKVTPGLELPKLQVLNKDLEKTLDHRSVQTGYQACTPECLLHTEHGKAHPAGKMLSTFTQGSDAPTSSAPSLGKPSGVLWQCTELMAYQRAGEGRDIEGRTRKIEQYIALQEIKALWTSLLYSKHEDEPTGKTLPETCNSSILASLSLSWIFDALI